MYVSKLSFEVISKSINWNTGGCNSFVIRNQGNVIVTIAGYITLAPGESFRSDDARPDVVIVSELKIEFDSASTVVDNSLYPGGKPGRDNSVTKTDRDARILLIRNFLTQK